MAGSKRESNSLCASCDRCRSRKTRCDGQRPCAACKTKYMKKHKVSSVEGIDPALFECRYSPAKRRGPAPGHKLAKENGLLSPPAAAATGGGSVASASSFKRKQYKRSTSKQRQQQGQKKRGGGGSGMDGALSVGGYTGGGSVGAPQPPAFGSGMTSSNMHSMNNNNMGNSSQQQQQQQNGGGNNFPLLPPLDPSAAAMQQHVLSTLGSLGLNMFANSSNMSNKNSDGNGSGASGSTAALGDTMASAQNAAQQQLEYVQQLQVQQQMNAQRQRREQAAAAFHRQGTGDGSVDMFNAGVGCGGSVAGSLSGSIMGSIRPEQQFSQQMPMQQANQSQTATTSTPSPQPVIGCTQQHVLKYLPLIHPTNPTGMHLRACYTLSFGGLAGLPTIPTDEEYCKRFDKSLEPYQLPKFDVAALQAARFAELAMGALSDMAGDGNTDLMLALVNASVLCLRDCAEECVHPSLIFDLARTYFFHAICRSHLEKNVDYNDSMVRYFKYRRVCLRYLSQLDGHAGVETLMAAIAFQDSLVYMIYNASEDDLPTVDIPKVSPPHPLEGLKGTDAEKKYGISISPSRVASNPINLMWIQGAPPVLINESAQSKSRVLDALACATRSLLDDAKSRQAKEPTQSSRGRIISRKRKFLSDAAETKDKSATEWVVDHHPDELSCTNLMSQASDLLNDDSGNVAVSHYTFPGHHLLITAMNAILNMDREESDGVQIHNTCQVLERITKRPILLSQGGPTYHMINNCAISLAHTINKTHAGGLENDSARETFYAVLNIYNGAKMLLEKHRTKLPNWLQCHEIPTAKLNAKSDEQVIDLSKIALCSSRFCQDCVAPGISAKEVADRAGNIKKDGQKSESGKDLDTNDRALLSVLSRIIAQEENSTTNFTCRMSTPYD